MKSTAQTKKNTPWFLLWFPPVLFLLVITVFSIYFGFQSKGNPEVIAQATEGATPYILLTAQMILLVLQFLIYRRQGVSMSDLGWQVGEGQSIWRELALGAAIGLPLGLLWIYALEPALSFVQGSVGDYVPAGSLFPALSATIIPFAIADVLLAPFVEENIYRGYGIFKLLPRSGTRTTILLTSLFFGLLHWSGGFWYILLTAVIVGIPFAILRQQRKNIFAPFGAHFSLNLVETLLLWLML
jgi:membrane protease YdiL (CAAX protease family)